MNNCNDQDLELIQFAIQIALDAFEERADLDFLSEGYEKLIGLKAKLFLVSKCMEHKAVARDNPVFNHDCDLCEFQFTADHHGLTSDIYICENVNDVTLISRYGNEGPDYRSVDLRSLVDGARF